MGSHKIWIRFLAVVAVLGTANSAFAVITALTPLKNFLADAQFIVVAKVEKLYTDKPALMLTVTEDLKGKAPFRKLPINLTADNDSKKEKHLLRKRLAPDLPVMLFFNESEGGFHSFGYSNGTWFHVLGRKTSKDTFAWRFTHGEPFLRRTFKGTTEELHQLVKDCLAGRKKPPPANDKEPPGYGPEVPEKKSGARSGERGTTGVQPGERESAPGCALCTPFLQAMIPLYGPSWAVVALPTLGAPLAILAILFPSVFGGAPKLFRLWAALFTVITLISLVYLVKMLFPGWIRGTWLASDGGWWFLMTAITFLGLVWSWRRYLHWASDPALFPSAGKAEVAVLWIFTVACLVAGLIWVLANKPTRFDPDWNLFLAFAGGVVVSALYTTYRFFVGLRRLALAMPSESLILFTALFGFTGFAAARLGNAGEIAGETTVAEGSGRTVVMLWDFQSKDKGLIVSSATVNDKHVYIASAHPTFKFGNLYCLDRQTGKRKWHFDDDGDFKQAFSSPCLANGKLYIGEGFHDDQNCKLYCIDAASGKKLWDFPTASQTESSPVVADGKVYFGAGNDGLYCLDAAGGKKIWQFPEKQGKRLLRVGAPPVVAGKRVYVGTGIDRNLKGDQGETALLCLDAGSGKLLWKFPVQYPSWGAPIVEGDLIYLGVGNGDIFTDADNPGGELLCLRDKGKEAERVWKVRVTVDNGILDRPVVDKDHIYFTSRNGNCYALAKKDGKEKWRTFLDSPVVAGPAVAICPDCGQGSVYAVATGGKVFCLDARSGKVQWTYSLEKQNAHLSSTPRVVVLREKEGERRRIYFGAGLDNVPNGRAVVFCLEDRIKDGK